MSEIFAKDRTKEEKRYLAVYKMYPPSHLELEQFLRHEQRYEKSIAGENLMRRRNKEKKNFNPSFK